MGAKVSKTGHVKRVEWGADDAQLADLGRSVTVADLERSAAATRAHNLHGLPEDVFRLIAASLSVPDVGRASRVCKTWRRVCYSDAVWRVIAQRLGLSVAGEGVRAHVAQSLAPAFVPERYREMPSRATELVTVRVGVMSPVQPAHIGGWGKSALVVRYIVGTFLADYCPTIEDSYRKQVELPYGAVILDVMDTAGEQQFTAMRDQYLRTCDVFIVAFTLPPTAEPDLLTALKETYESAQRVRDVDRPSVVVVRTCCDLPGDLAPLPAVVDWCRSLNLPFVSTSALTGHNVDKAFELCVRVALLSAEGRRLIKPHRKD